ncbi:NAD kinase [Spirochaetia bacterium]|nr:NAD kinase [Spirochaetia bacterium]
MLAKEIKNELGKQGMETRFFSYTDNPILERDFDIALSLGGDGTVLFTARSVSALGVPILPLNLGTLGFIASVHPSKWLEVFNRWRDNNVTFSERLMLDVHVERAGKTVFSMPALNDAVISASGIAKTIRLVALSKEMHVGSYRSDGLIAATPTGSTAYCASAGGPILDPEMEAIILNPICPFTLLYRPLVLPPDKITVKVEPDQRSGVLLTIDGQLTEALEPNDLVMIQSAPFKARFIASGRHAFFSALHSKLAMLGGGNA